MLNCILVASKLRILLYLSIILTYPIFTMSFNELISNADGAARQGLVNVGENVGRPNIFRAAALQPTTSAPSFPGSSTVSPTLPPFKLDEITTNSSSLPAELQTIAKVSKLQSMLLLFSRIVSLALIR